MVNKKLILLLAVTLLVAGIYAQPVISLAGTWDFKMDPSDKGMPEKWFSAKFSEQVKLPGSMLDNGKGDAVTLQTKWTGSIYDSSWFFNPRFAKYRQPGDLHFPFWLTPAKYYVGAAWYQKTIVIPAGWKSQYVRLFLERCHTETMVWIDDKPAGLQNSMVAPHIYNFKDVSPGSHRITIRVDNRIKEINVGPDSHSLTDHTQGNWNGVVGRLELQALPATVIDSLQVYPQVANKSVNISFTIGGDLKNIRQLNFTASVFSSSTVSNSKPVLKQINGSALAKDMNGRCSVSIDLGKDARQWDEFSPALYRLTMQSITTDGKSQVLKTQFGLRDFKVKGSQFEVNGRRLFLRGTVENCVFPLTGYASMKEADWERIFRICRSYGLNHMRFHSYCPPEAAFAAADRVGFYLQPEGPSWANHGSSLGDGKPIDQFIFDETDRMMQAYGNHPSYCMLAYGNEPRGGHQAEYLARFIKYWKEKDSRRVYTGASVAMSWPLVPSNEFMIKSGARNLSWNRSPESVSDYTAAIEKFDMPYVAHEMGQWCVFPNFSEIKKYTGPYKAKNFELFRDDLADQGMGDEANDFVKASGYLQALCYKNEIEKSLRTPGNGGFQLLSLNDYPGQGTALVGVLDAFWDEKGYQSAGQFSRFCNSTVPLLRLPGFVYTAGDSVTGNIEIYHYGPKNLDQATITWKATGAGGQIMAKGKITNQQITTGRNTSVGVLNITTGNIMSATRLHITVSIEGTAFSNDWDVWVFPAAKKLKEEEAFYTTDTLDAKATQMLAAGGKVLLLAAGKVVKGKEVIQSFTPVFWNTSWFKMRPPHTLGFIVKNKHAAFADFPTEAYPDLQWWDVVQKAQVMHLEDFPKGFRPLLQPIDTWFLNRRLAMLFEAKVGKGKLVVTSIEAGNLDKRPAARQLFMSISKYMNSEKFNPQEEVALSVVQDLFHSPSKYVFDAYTKDSPDELKPKK